MDSTSLENKKRKENEGRKNFVCYKLLLFFELPLAGIFKKFINEVTSIQLDRKIVNWYLT